MRKFILLTIGILTNTFCFSQYSNPLRVVISTNCDYHAVMVWDIEYKTGTLHQSCYSTIEENNQNFKDTTFVFDDMRIVKRLAKQVSKDQKKIADHFHGIHEIYMTIEIIYQDHSESVIFNDYSRDELKEANSLYLKFYLKYFELVYNNYGCYGNELPPFP